MGNIEKSVGGLPLFVKIIRDDFRKILRGNFADKIRGGVDQGVETEADSDFEHELNVNKLQIICKITDKALRKVDEKNYSDEVKEKTKKRHLSYFGREFFENLLTQQFCDAVVIGKNLVLKDKDGNVKVFDASEIDGEKMRERMKDWEHILKLRKERDENLKQYPKEVAEKLRAQDVKLNSFQAPYPDSEAIMYAIRPIVDSGEGGTVEFQPETIERIREITGREGVLKAQINSPFELKMPASNAASLDPSVLRVYGLDKLQEILRG